MGIAAEVVSNGVGVGAILAPIIMLGVIALVLWGSVSAIRSARQSRPADPKAILDERLARGEIDESEYLRLSDLIREGRSSRLM